MIIFPLTCNKRLGLLLFLDFSKQSKKNIAKSTPFYLMVKYIVILKVKIKNTGGNSYIYIYQKKIIKNFTCTKMNWKLKWTFLIISQSSVCLSVCLSVYPSVCKIFTFSTSSLDRTTEPISTKLGTEQFWVKLWCNWMELFLRWVIWPMHLLLFSPLFTTELIKLCVSFINYF